MSTKIDTILDSMEYNRRWLHVKDDAIEQGKRLAKYKRYDGLGRIMGDARYPWYDEQIAEDNR